MAVTENFYTGNGSTTSYSFTFPYIDEDDIKVTLDGTLTSAYTLANATTILFNTAPANDVAIRIYRDTNVDSLKSTFFAGSAIRAQDLNEDFLQNNYAVQELKNTTWDNELQTIHSDEPWVSSDSQIATTAAMDARFQDEANETITSAEVWPDNDDTVATTAAIDNRVDSKIDAAITGDIATDGTGITITDDGDGTITLGLGSGLIDLDRIKAEDIVTSAEVWANNDSTIATTAKIDDMIDAAITGDIAVDATGLTLTDDGDGTITLGIGAGSVDLDRINAGDIINLAEQNAGSPLPADTNIFTASAAANRFDTLVQTATPSGSDWEVGKTWLQNDDDLTLSIWNGSGWTAVSSGGAFTEQPSVVYVDQASGDDNNTGHRISTPKATIKGAIEQINEEIDIELTSGGSGYVTGSYSSVALTGGTGTGLTANITVNGAGVVSAVTLTSRTPLVNTYYIGDVLSASNVDLGGTGSGLQITVTGDGDGQIVVVSAGVYQEAAPIQIKRRNVSIIGQALRSCLVHPTVATETNNLFELNSGSYLSSLTFTGVKAGSGTGNTIDATLPVTQGWNAAFYNDAFITKSPYIQNCTNFSDSEIDNSNLNAHNPAGGQAGDTDSAPTGGGLLVNGAVPHDDSPLRSMVCDSYTHVALNGPGILVTNNGYAQCTSSYAFFNKYHIKALNGGQANLAASTTDFGEFGLVAEGRSTDPIFTAALSTAANDGDTVFTIDEPVADPSWHGTATRPQSNMLVELNGVTYPVLSAVANGSGWDVTISRPNPTNRSENLGLDGNVTTPATAEFALRSMIASSGHTMEYVGSGTNYNALPENGGVPVDANRIVESDNGKVWTAITDHNGKFSVGDFFEVDQRTGFINFSAGSYAFDVVTDATPQLGGELDAQNNKIVNLDDPTAAQDAATKTYVDTADGTKLSLSGGTMTGDITFNAGQTFSGVLPLAGGTMTGAIDMGSNLINNVTNPVSAQDAATKNYVDTELAGLSTNSISQNNSNVTVTDDNVAAGEINITIDGTTTHTIFAGAVNQYATHYQQSSNINLVDQGEVRWWEDFTNGTNYVGFKAPAALAASTTWTLPSADGTNGQLLGTNGTGTLSWQSALKSADIGVTVQGYDADTAKLNIAQTYIATISGTERTIYAGSFDLSTGNFWTCGAIAIPNPTNATAGTAGLIRVTAAPVSFGGNFKFPGGGGYTAPTTFPAVIPFYVVSSSQILLGNFTEGIA